MYRQVTLTTLVESLFSEDSSGETASRQIVYESVLDAWKRSIASSTAGSHQQRSQNERNRGEA